MSSETKSFKLYYFYYYLLYWNFTVYNWFMKLFILARLNASHLSCVFLWFSSLFISWAAKTWAKQHWQSFLFLLADFPNYWKPDLPKKDFLTNLNVLERLSILQLYLQIFMGNPVASPAPEDVEYRASPLPPHCPSSPCREEPPCSPLYCREGFHYSPYRGGSPCSPL